MSESKAKAQGDYLTSPVPSEGLQTALPNGPRDATGALSLKDRTRLVKCLRELGHSQAADEIEALQTMLDKLIPVMSAAVNMTCAPGWEIESDEDEELEQVLRAQGFCIAAPDAAACEAVSGSARSDEKTPNSAVDPLRESHDALVSVLSKVAKYAAAQMWHLQGGNRGSAVQSLSAEIESALSTAAAIPKE